MDHHNNKFDYKFKITALFIFVSAFVFFSPASAQKRKSDIPPLKERLFFGGNIGLQFGTVTDIQISPIAGLWVLPRVAIALGPDYRYYKDPNFSTDIFGGSAYLQFHFIKDFNSILPVGIHMGLFIHIENELLSLKSSDWKLPPYSSDRFYLNTLLAGGGISQPLGRRSSLDLMFLWTLTEDYYSFYGNPEIRFSFNF